MAEKVDALDAVIRLETGTGETSTAEPLPPVENGVRAAVAQTTGSEIMNDETGPLEDPRIHEEAYNALYAAEYPYDKPEKPTAHPYPQVGQPVIVDDTLMATWMGDDESYGMAPQINTGMGDADSW